MPSLIGQSLDAFNRLPIWRRQVKLWGQRLVAPSGDRLLHLWLHRAGLMGGEAKRTLTRLTKPGMTVLDIGANQGAFSLLLSSLVGNGGHVHAFEPEPALFGAMQGNLVRNGITNVTAYPVALGKEPGTMTLHRSLLNSGDNRLGVSPTWSRDVTVTLDTLDRLLPTAEVDLIKLDVQGFELPVLQGAEALLARSPRVKILLEFWNEGLRMAGTEPADLLAFLIDRGFRLYDPADWSSPRDHAALLRRGAAHNNADILAVRE